MDKLVGILRKLGILRFGKNSGTYTSVKDMPTELFMNNVYDEKKDLVHKEDVAAVKNSIGGSNKPNPKKSTKSRKVFAAVVLLMGAFILLAQLFSGFSFSLVISIVLWVVLFIFLKKFAYLGYYSFWLMLVIAIFVIVVTLVMVPSPDSDKDGASGSGASSATLTDANFDKKVLKITSADGSVKGTIGLTKQKTGMGKAYLSAAYNMLLKSELPFNAKCGNMPEYVANGGPCPKGYEYGGRLVPVKQVGEKDGNGSVSPVFCNKDQLAADPYNISGTGQTLKTCGISTTSGLVTDTYATNFSTNYFSYAEILKTNTFEVYDLSNYWEPVKGQPGSYTSNVDKAVRETNPVKILTFTVSE